MSLRAAFDQLTPAQQRRVHLRLCEHALEVWRAHADVHAPIRYVDSVVGMHHQVDADLPADALRSATAGEDLANVSARYTEPIVALQDDDLELPDPIEFAYYAIYNCFRLHVRHDAIDPWLVVNQALSSNPDEATWSPRLAAAIAAP